MNNKETRRKIYEEIETILEKKNHDYGDSVQKSYDIFGPMAAVIRMNDKMNRAITLCKGEKAQVDESLRETLMDLLGYNFLLLAMMEDEKEEIIGLKSNYPDIVNRFIETVIENDGSITNVQWRFDELSNELEIKYACESYFGDRIARFVKSSDGVWRGVSDLSC